MRKVIPLAGLAVLLAYTTTPARAWEPTHPIEIIVPAGTGGGADQMARTDPGHHQPSTICRSSRWS